MKGLYRSRYRHPDLVADERAIYRREALADARAEREAHEAGFNSAQEYEDALAEAAGEVWS